MCHMTALKKSILVLGFVLPMVFLPAAARGTEAELPLIDPKGLEGSWEAVNFEDLRVVRMTVQRTGASFLAMVVGHGRPLSALYRVETTTATQGRVKIRAISVRRPSERLEINGIGRAIEGEGRISATATLLVDNKVLNKWNLDFHKGGDTLEEVATLARVAKQTIPVEARKGIE